MASLNELLTTMSRLSCDAKANSTAGMSPLPDSSSGPTSSMTIKSQLLRRALSIAAQANDIPRRLMVKSPTLSPPLKCLTRDSRAKRTSSPVRRSITLKPVRRPCLSVAGQTIPPILEPRFRHESTYWMHQLVLPDLVSPVTSSLTKDPVRRQLLRQSSSRLWQLWC